MPPHPVGSIGAGGGTVGSIGVGVDDGDGNGCGGCLGEVLI